MESVITGKTKSGKKWIPRFISTLDSENCLGCGRCFKICGKGVLAPSEMDDEDDEPRMVMEIVNAEDCIGCEACGKVCVKKCQTFSRATLIELEITSSS